MSATVTDPAAKMEITEMLLERVARRLEQHRRLLQADELDRAALQDSLDAALRLSLIALEELEELGARA
jgi:hypothetical protein